MKTGVLVLNFGEPETPTLEEVVPFLERIFMANASLEGNVTQEAAQARSRRLAEARAPGLMADYEAIGGSPMNEQAALQCRLLEAELVRRGMAATCYGGMQFTEPTIAEAVARARKDGVDRLVALPLYPLCGRSTTVAALASFREEVARLEWDVEVAEISGWHRHQEYTQLHADHISTFAHSRGLDLASPRTRLVFSAHGTPIKYLNEGNRYDRYVDDVGGAIAGALGVEAFTLGFQNHGNRPIEWTQPPIDQAFETIDADDAVVVAVSFMHEQSETLSELDRDLREHVEGLGVRFHRVPVPFDSDRFIGVLADLVEGRLRGVDADVGGHRLRPCRCRPDQATYCLNRN